MRSLYFKAKQANRSSLQKSLRVFEMPNSNSDILKFLAKNNLQNLNKLAHPRNLFTSPWVRFYLVSLVKRLSRRPYTLDNDLAVILHVHQQHWSSAGLIPPNVLLIRAFNGFVYFFFFSFLCGQLACLLAGASTGLLGGQGYSNFGAC